MASATTDIASLVNAHREQIHLIVSAHRATNPRVFGSVARGESNPASDLDLLVDAQPGMTLFDQGAIICELEELLGVPVDVVTSGAGSARFRAAIVADAVSV